MARSTTSAMREPISNRGASPRRTASYAQRGEPQAGSRETRNKAGRRALSRALRAADCMAVPIAPTRRAVSQAVCLCTAAGSEEHPLLPRRASRRLWRLPLLSDGEFRPTVTGQLHYADTAIAHPRARLGLRGLSISRGVERAVPGILVLVAAAPMALSVIAVRAPTAMNYCRWGHEVLVHVPRAHDDIVERQLRCVESPDVADVLI